MPSTARRMDEVIRREGPDLVRVLPDVLRGPSGSQGPAWLFQPDLATQKRFWTRLGGVIPAGAEVFAARGWLGADQILDVHEAAIPQLTAPLGRCALFFLDLEPDSNWAHPCRYILLAEDGTVVEAEHEWPPQETIEIVPIRQPL